MKRQCVGVTADWSNVVGDISEPFCQYVAKTEWAKAKDRKQFIGGGRIADNSSTLQYLNPLILTFTTYCPWILITPSSHRGDSFSLCKASTYRIDSGSGGVQRKWLIYSKQKAKCHKKVSHIHTAAHLNMETFKNSHLWCITDDISVITHLMTNWQKAVCWQNLLLLISKAMLND